MTPRERQALRRNAGRCDICGKVLSLDDGDHLIVYGEADMEPAPGGLGLEDVVRGHTRALRFTGSPEDHALADALEEKPETVTHRSCFKQTALGATVLD